MLLGCCHCGQTPSESTPPSQSQSQSVRPQSIDEIFSPCAPCTAVPRRFTASLSGWSGLFAAHNACCGSINGTYTISEHPLANYTGAVVHYIGCTAWKSDTKCTNQNTATGTPPSCLPHATRPLVEMVSCMKTIGSTSMRYALTVWTITPGGFGSVFWPWIFEGDDIGGDLTKCLYPTLNATVNSSNPNARCSPGTVTLTPL
jgi:hypothetical protein